MKKLLVTLSALALVGCGNLSAVDKNGHVESPVWPEAKEATISHQGAMTGSYVNLEMLGKLTKGASKEAVRRALGSPHFGEGLFGVREWDYVFNFLAEDGVKQCQLKLTFDQYYNLAEKYWMPTNCEDLLYWE